ncbi:hypothetical protein [Streptomyces graminilatus]|uniref:hypothetical protein n=1 Tax=Streptomyces graminilatus TaxID=1464070 RepID=UPI0012FE9D19|nr:hypothetical protein [Streptomyces graminilatus]
MTFEPALWYAVTARDNNETCRNYEQTFPINPFYSNDGVHVSVQCGVCGQPMEILTAELLDPQPEVS